MAMMSAGMGRAASLWMRVIAASHVSALAAEGQELAAPGWGRMPPANDHLVPAPVRVDPRLHWTRHHHLALGAAARPAAAPSYPRPRPAVRRRHLRVPERQPHPPPGQAGPLRELVLRDGAGGGPV